MASKPANKHTARENLSMLVRNPQTEFDAFFSRCVALALDTFELNPDGTRNGKYYYVDYIPNTDFIRFFNYCAAKWDEGERDTTFVLELISSGKLEAGRWVWFRYEE